MHTNTRTGETVEKERCFYSKSFQMGSCTGSLATCVNHRDHDNEENDPCSFVPLLEAIILVSNT